MELLLKTAPMQEPLSLEEVRFYLRLSAEQEDAFLLDLIAAARAHVETFTGRALLKQKWQMKLKPPYPRVSPLVRRFEKQLIINVPKPPLLSVESLTVKEVSLPFRQEENKIILSPPLWEEELKITFWAGYGETAVSLPPDLKMAVLMATRFLYDHQSVDLPLLQAFKVFHVV